MELKSEVKNKVLHSQSREIVANIINYMQEESLRYKELGKAQERAAKATGISLRRVQRIAQEMRSIHKGDCKSFATPNKRRNKSANKTKLDDLECIVLRRMVMNYFVTERKVPSTVHIYNEFAEKTGYKGSRESLRVALHELGFRWRKARKLLVERHNIRSLRLNYLRNINRYRQENRPIIYLDETYIYSSLTLDKNCSLKGIQKPVSKKGTRIVVMHAGGENGFIVNSYLKFKSRNRSGDYNTELSYESYKSWLREVVLPNLPVKSVIVIDNAPYLNIQNNKYPTSMSRKEEMIQWLQQRNIPFSDQMLKPDLHALIKSYKPRYKTYDIDKVFHKFGHDVLRLPPNHPDLNPLKLVWSALKQFIAQMNISFKTEDVDNLCDQFIDNFTAEDWKYRCEQAKEAECFLLNIEPEMDSILRDLLISLGDDDSDYDSSSSLDSIYSSCEENV